MARVFCFFRTFWNSSSKELGPSTNDGPQYLLHSLWLRLREINFPLRRTQLCFCCFHQSNPRLHHSTVSLTHLTASRNLKISMAQSLQLLGVRWPGDRSPRFSPGRLLLAETLGLPALPCSGFGVLVHWIIELKQIIAKVPSNHNGLCIWDYYKNRSEFFLFSLLIVFSGNGKSPCLCLTGRQNLIKTHPSGLSREGCLWALKGLHSQETRSPHTWSSSHKSESISLSVMSDSVRSHDL